MHHQRSFRFVWVVLILSSLWVPTSVVAQTAAEIWQDVNETALVAAKGAAAPQRTVIPLRYRTLRMDGAALGRALAKAPREFTAAARAAAAEFFLPLTDGSFARCALEDSPVFEAGFEAKHPEFKTYLARGLDDPSLSARLDRTPQGFHAIIFSASGTTYIDPYWRGDTTTYIAYRRVDYRNAAKPFNCLLPEEEVVGALREFPREAPRPTGGSLRTYRLAVGCTGEYAAAAGGGTLDGALSAIVTTVNRVSGLYERDFAIRLVLISNEDQLVFINPNTDPYSNSSPSTLLTQNQNTCDSVIGTANYDIGHVFTTGGGGLASLAVVGRAGFKARGETGLSNPVGDPYDIDYVAHEMGHQFGGNHPFNGNSGSCAGSTRVAATAYEPGSGTTIMAYAGICTGQNLAPNSDDYFHTVNYDEIDTYTSGAGLGNVGVPTNTGNTPPTINALTSYTIPNQTPFALTAGATDPDPDVLTYCWEEFDLGPAQDPTVAPRDNGSSPIFRSFAPTTSPTRLFPSLTYILNNANVPPATVGSFVTGEFLPTTNRTMTFRVTVRDNHAGGGGSNYASTTVTSTTAAGPFAVTSFENAAAPVAAGSTQTINWNVANTTGTEVNCANVKISLSTDGGRTFPYVLAASTLNDGTEDVTIPNTANVATTQGRFKVEAVGNIFFDISGADLTITSGVNTAPVVTVTDAVTVQRGTPTPVVMAIATADDLDTPLTATISDVPDDAVVTASISGSTVTVSALATCSLTTTLTSRTYPVTLTVTDNLGASTARPFDLIVQPNPSPTLGTYPSHSVLRGATLVNPPSVGPADANNNLGAAPFSVTPKTFPGEGGAEVVTVNQVTGEVTASPTAAAQVGTYRIQVTLQDSCGAAVVRSFNLPVLSATNQQPTLTPIPDPAAINEDAGTQIVNLSGISAGPGETQGLTVTAISNNTAVIPNPTVNYPSADPTKGSLSFAPVANAFGSAMITVTVKDDALAENGGMDTVSQTFTVTVNPVEDPPTLATIANPARLPVSAGQQTVNLSGISAGGGESQPLTVTAESDTPALIPDPTVTYTSPNATGSLNFTPETGKTGTAVVTVKVSDGVGEVTRTFTVKVGFADLLGVYNGLALPAAFTASKVEKTGLIKLMTTKKGGVTGKLKLGSDSFGLKGFLNSSGDVLFGKAPGTVSVMLKRKDDTILALTLHISLNGAADKFTGALTANSVAYVGLVADRAIYSSKLNPFPAARIVPYTAIFDQPSAGSLPATGFPHGDGFGTVKLSKTGSAKIVASLADGTKFSSSNFLSNGDFLPLWVPFFKGKGALSGSVHFVTVAGTSDFASADMLWFRPPTTKGPFPAGWPDGITTDLLGSTYIVSKAVPACLPTLEDPDVNQDGNAELTLSDGKLAANLRKALAIDKQKNKVEIKPAGVVVDDLKLAIGGKIGLFKGGFVHPATGKKIKLQGVIFQQQKFGSGFFLSTDDNKDIQSGGVSVVVDNSPLNP